MLIIKQRHRFNPVLSEIHAAELLQIQKHLSWAKKHKKFVIIIDPIGTYQIKEKGVFNAHK